MMCDRGLDDDIVEILGYDDLKNELVPSESDSSDTESQVLSVLLLCLILCSCTAVFIYVSLQM
jgi:hypothetical protein